MGKNNKDGKRYTEAEIADLVNVTIAKTGEMYVGLLRLVAQGEKVESKDLPGIYKSLTIITETHNNFVRQLKGEGATDDPEAGSV